MPPLHHRRSIRLAAFDYRSVSAYFVTICTEGRRQRFGHIDGGCVHLSGLGALVEHCWLQMPLHFAHVTLDQHVVMPDHVHGVIVIEDRPRPRGMNTNASSGGFASAPAGSLPVVVRLFKATVTRLTRQHGASGALWQRNYYEHVIRDERDLDRVRRYIAENPGRWEERRGAKEGGAS